MQTGEKVALTSSRTLSRSGRQEVSFRIVGDHSFGWSEAASVWGGHIDQIVHRQQPNHKICQLFKLPRSISVAQALSSPPPAGTQWNGIMLATISSDQDSSDVFQLFSNWQPLIAIIAVPSTASRKQRSLWLQFQDGSTPVKTYVKLSIWNVRHADAGGVTTSCWHFHRISRGNTLGQASKQAVMMAPQFTRHLQTALQDTIGGSKWESKEFEKADEALSSSGITIVGHMSSIKHQLENVPVYSADGLAPDIGQLSRNDRVIWVSANSVYGKGDKVVRPVTIPELFAIWDYEGKFETRNWSPVTISRVLNQRLASPPAKLLRSFAFTAGETLLSRSHSSVASFTSLPPPGISSSIPFNPMEEAVSTRVRAAQADDAEVDLSQWASPLETVNEARARKVLRRFVVKWWSYHQRQVAEKWLKSLGSLATKDDVEAVNDCLRRVQGCDYWSWHRGSRIMFYKFPTEWRNDFRDGIPFWKLTNPPRGYMRNMESPSREAELLTRLKIFKLKYQYYLDEGNPSLLCPRFTVPTK